MSGGKYFEWIIIYYAIDIGGSKKKSFRSLDRNIIPLCASKIVLLDSSAYSKRDASGDATSSGYSNLPSPTVNLTLNGSDFSGR